MSCCSWARPRCGTGDAPGNPSAGRRDWTQTITAVTALGALLFTALSLQATREQIEVSEQGQITDRYAKAVELLGTSGAENFQTRLGGIYALERLAADSPRDQQTVVEVLSAFIRATSPRTDPAKPCPDTPADVEAAFVVITRRTVANDPRRPVAGLNVASSVNLRHTCLAEMRAFNADLSSMSLVGADLSGSELNRAHGGLISLTDAKLTGTNLSSADLSNFVFLTRTDLSGARLDHAKIGPTMLTDVNLTNADLRGADLRYSTFTNVILTGAQHDKGTNTEGATHDPRTVGAWW
ncbi:Pentapeptide repeat-containing protein [Actinokineospora alba]|uniref:Pentapeptide repeat-containing protein n=1 Tax=Actinokineospora alba TaxID=504798 RepID=A0A1H0GBU5_9PSEU|nr:pentapeptide repeat-containing protein [Actinokineospora alba]TDP69836.1 pentapeptide repeat protein [Actinokineospora alba]SDI07591.1 Pentapeptide repeat-containing protein [Actinokineospora alba]SDO04343.1 Pentapeptide repeat-containing protein [Actinokineospora alba]